LGTALKNLAEKPEIMRKVYEEVIRCSPEGEELTYDQVRQKKKNNKNYLKSDTQTHM
jgi:hypothetical protein